MPDAVNDARENLALRSLTLGLVVALHAALLAALLHSTLPGRRAAAENSVEVAFIAPARSERVRLDRIRPQSLSPKLLAAVTAPALTAVGDAGNGSGARRGNDGLNADWVAEAHRAIKAYEIRRDEPPVNPMSGATRDYWELQREHVHRAGDRYKTENGDWIVWIDDRCFKIAEWHHGDPNYGNSPPRVVCPEPAPIKAE